MLRDSTQSRLVILGVLSLLLVGCGGGDDTGGTTAGSQAAPVDIENPGTITGQVSFTGTAPPGQPIDMSEEPVCQAKHQQPAMRQAVQVNDNGTLRYVFVWISEGIDQAFPVPAGEAPELDQEGCVYVPHVVGVQTGQNLAITNSDAVLHNVNAQPSVNRGFNVSQPREGMTSQRSFAQQEIMIPVQCDVHGWMQAYIGVVDHPYFDVTGTDGSFRIENLPPGDYVIEAWHEQLGTQRTNVTVPPNGTVEASFTYS